jgi:Ca2+-binding RTX toxin-like protein
LAIAAMAACLLATVGGGAAHANTSHEGWPKIDGVLKINKDDGSETMSGTAKSDELLGGHDSDTIYGRDSADVLWGD